jgi:hypothetical protein
LIEAGYRDLVRKSRSRAGASRDDCLFLLHVIIAMFRPGSCFRTESDGARRRFEFEMKLRFERNPIRDYEEQGEKADPVQVHHGMTR